MENVNFLKYQILIFVNHIDRIYNVNQLEHSILSHLLDKEKYEDGFNKAYRFLKDNNFINVGKNNSGTDTVSSLTEKGQAVLNFKNWEEYIDNVKSEKQKEKDTKDIDFKLKKATLKNQRFTPYTSIAGLVFGLGSMIWSIMKNYNLVFINIWIYFIVLILLTMLGIFLYKKA